LNAAVACYDAGATAVPGGRNGDAAACCWPAIDALKTALGDTENKYVVRMANHALNELEGTDRSVP